MVSIASYNKRFEALKSERSSFVPVWRELSDYHLAYRGRFLSSDRNKGFKRNTKQLNNASRLSTRTLASGMMAGITSPARPWFRLSTGDPNLQNSTAVTAWLQAVQDTMYRVFSESNFYNSLHQLYSELGVFGTGVMGIYEDFENVIWCKPYTVGSYCISADGRNNVNTFYREYQNTVSQVVEEFGYENCSHSVQQNWDKGNTEAWVDVVHVIEPNDDRDGNSALAKDMPIRSAYFEKSAGKGRAAVKFLRESGFKEFPILAPRWDIAGEDIYATDCPGMTALGDTKALQLGEKRMYQAVDKVANPPLQGPSNLKNKVNSLAADEILWLDGSSEGLSSIYPNYRPDLNALDAINMKAEERIKRAFYEDLFLMLSNSDRRQITAREVAEKHEEKLLMLGPVLERLHTELLDPAIDRTFNILQEAGVLPPPPPELQDKQLDVEYVSVLAQAQRLVATGSLERLGGFVGQLVTVWPEARHKFDAVNAVDEYAEALGVSPEVIRTDDQVEELVNADAQAAAAQQQQAQTSASVDMAKTASEADTGGENALTDMMAAAGVGQ